MNFICADSINVWLLRNNLLLNTNKTELINISISPNRFPIVNVDNIQINSKSKVKNVGVISRPPITSRGYRRSCYIR